MKLGKPRIPSAGAVLYRTVWLSVDRIPKPSQSLRISTPGAVGRTKKTSTTPQPGISDGSTFAVEKNMPAYRPNDARIFSPVSSNVPFAPRAIVFVASSDPPAPFSELHAA